MRVRLAPLDEMPDRRYRTPASEEHVNLALRADWGSADNVSAGLTPGNPILSAAMSRVESDRTMSI